MPERTLVPSGNVVAIYPSCILYHNRAWQSRTNLASSCLCCSNRPSQQNEHMSEKAFADLEEAVKNALAFERGQRRDLTVTRVQSPRPQKARNQKTTNRLDGAKRRS